MKIAIMGAGGEGGFFGSRLTQSGNEVTLIARGPTLAALRSNGLTVRSGIFGNVTMRVRATDRPEEVGYVDLVMFCVKAYDLEVAAGQMKPLVGPGTAVLPVLNGIDISDSIGEVVGLEHVLGGLSWVNASVEKPGVVNHGGSARLIFGELDGSNTDRSRRIQGTLKEAGISAELHPEIRTALWEKFVAMCAINGVFSLARLPAGPICECPATWELLRLTMEEGISVAREVGINLPADFTDKNREVLKSYKPWARPSMLVDLAAGRRLELEALNGTLCKLGREKGVDTPVNSTIYMALKPYENGAPSVPVTS
jgi:2-dehydropantoate 2-reductase